MLDVLVLLICAIAAIVGWRQGTLLTVLPLAGLAGGYAAAFALYRPLGDPLAGLGVPPVLAYALAGLGIFLIVVLVFRALAWGVRRREDRPSGFERAMGLDEDELAAAGPAHRGRSLPDRVGGALLNALWAFGVVMILAWAAESWVAVRGTGADARVQSVTGRVGGEVVGGVAERITASRLGDEFSGSAVGALLRDPGEFRRMLDALAAKPAVRQLAADPEFMRLLAEGRVAELARRPELQQLLEDAEVRDALRRMGVVEGVEALSADQLADALARSLGPMAGALGSLREEADFAALAERLDLGRRLRDGDLLALLADADLTALLSRLAEQLRGRTR